ncbi:MAG: DUF2066 domain-containing protein [Gammaproteobacteria bacterium]|nr:DUF2066 domain-containing protein [Gammaproteobacteria bacterium]
MKSKKINQYSGRLIHTIYCILLLGVFFIPTALADSMETLYEVSVKVSDNNTENELINKGFASVLVKVSGNSKILTSPKYHSLVAKAHSALSQFRYDYIASARDVSVKEKWFWVRFNPKVIDDLLNTSNIPIWNRVRPKTLVWFSQEIAGQRYLHDQYDAPEIYSILHNKANQRGISLMYPFLDLQDRSNVSINDIWNNFNDKILFASKRYQAQSVLTSRIFQDSKGAWISQWSFLILGEIHNWEITDKSLTTVLEAGIDKLADKLAQQLAQTNHESTQSNLLVQISNIKDFKDFQRLDDYFRGLATVKSLSLVKLEHDKIVYNINHLGKVYSFVQEISLGDLLNPVEQAHNDFSYDDYKTVVADNNQGNTRAIAVQEATIPKELQIDLDYWLIR